jgi:uncharacterized protein
MTILITGGTGTVGKAVTNLLLQNNYKVIVVSRKSLQSNHPNLSYAIWNPANNFIDILAFQNADAIINLAGEGVADKRWTNKRKIEIEKSRVDSCNLLVNTIGQHPNKIKTVISASATGWYNPSNDINNPLQENSNFDNSFLGNTCQKWEAAIYPISHLGIRLVKLRIGIVLSNNGGAFVAFKKPLQFGVNTFLGTGKQLISWIHVNDLAAMFLFALQNQNINGVYNAVAPEIVTNKNFSNQLAKKINRKFLITTYIPSFILKIILGELSIEVLKSSSISCKKILDANFTYKYPTVDSAFTELLSK